MKPSLVQKSTGKTQYIIETINNQAQIFHNKINPAYPYKVIEKSINNFGIINNFSNKINNFDQNDR